MEKASYPKVVRHDSRIAFGIDFFATEEEADRAAAIVRERDDRYNGGWWDGYPCGRAREFDHTYEGRKIYAVTVA